MHIYLIRHTAYDNPKNVYAFHLPFNLSLEGRSHASNIGSWFEENSLNKIPIYSSPIVRCVQTSEIIASKTNSFVSVDKRLIETSCPALQGVKNTSFELEADDPSRESRESIIKRMTNILEEKIKLGKNCILVSHGDPTTLLNHHLKKIEAPKYIWKPERSDNIMNKGDILDIEIDNGSIKSTKKITGLK